MQNIRNIIRARGLRGELLRGGVGAGAVKAGGLGLSLIVTLVLARALGPEGYGIYSYVLALVGLMAIPAQFGLPQLVVRETARASSEAYWARLKGIWCWAAVATLLLSLLIAVPAGATAWFFSSRLSEVQFVTFVLGLVLVPLLALSHLCGAALRGLFHVVAGQVPDLLLRPGLFVLLLAGALLLQPGMGLTAERAMAIHVLAGGMALIAAMVLLACVWPGQLRSLQPRFEHRFWASAVFPLGLTSALMLINQKADVLLLGLLMESHDVGIYRVAAQGAVIAAFGLQAVNMVVAPQFTRMHAQGNMVQLQKLATISARAAFTLALAVTAVYLFFGARILEVAVGEEYAAGSLSLTILAVGQLVSAATGSAGIILNMTDNHGVVARSVAVAAVANIFANLALIPAFGVHGAALATTFTFVLWNALLARAVYKKLGIEPAVIRFRSNKRQGV